MGEPNPTIIGVASGKGGTGKTTIAVSLALSLATWQGTETPSPFHLQFLDCDVEAPNAHLFLKPDLEPGEPVDIPIPNVDADHCNACGRCAEVCPYHAIAVLGKRVLVFPQLCHGCGSCTLNCPENAITEIPKSIGRLERGWTPERIDFRRGLLDIGEPMAVPVIRQLKRWSEPTPRQVVIRDIPPGSSCPVVEASRGADFLILVTEPTPFGLHDLKLAFEVTEALKIPAGVILNRCNEDSRDPGAESSYQVIVENYCAEKDLPVLMRIPNEQVIAEGIARGRTLLDIHPAQIHDFREMFTTILRLSSESAKAVRSTQTGGGSLE